MSDFDYAAWVRRAVAFVASLPERGMPDARISLHVIAPPKIDPSLPEDYVQEPGSAAYESALCMLPGELQKLYREGATEISCLYWVVIDNAYYDGGPIWISPENIIKLKKLYDEIFPEGFLPTIDKTTNNILKNFIPFIEIKNGDLIAIDPDPENQKVYYVAHDDLSAVISNSLPEFLMAWERCCYIGPESWDLEKYGGLSSDCHLSGDTEAAKALRALLGGRE